MHLLELADKVLRSFVSDGLCDGSDCHIGVKKKLLGSFNADRTQNAGIGQTGKLFDESGGIFVGIMKFFRQFMKRDFLVIILNIFNDRISLYINSAVEKRHLNCRTVIPDNQIEVQKQGITDQLVKEL